LNLVEQVKEGRSALNPAETIFISFFWQSSNRILHYQAICLKDLKELCSKKSDGCCFG
jgi:hypothetical protein